MQTPHIIKVKQQDTPIKTLLFHWREDDTDYSVEVPLSWAIIANDGKCTDRDLNGEGWAIIALFDSIRRNPAEWVESIRTNFPEHIASLTCSDAPTPEIFAV